MNAGLVHRGPDDSGEFFDSHVALAMRRLAIIDRVGARQPLLSEDGSIVLVANGEIYNYLELRKGLEGRGHRFSTHGDCETIIHLYEEYGTAAVDHLRGMFAFALYDGRRRRLVLARDRMGEKPLYLYETEGAILFASEMKSLLRSGKVAFALEPEAIDMYFRYQYVPEPRTPLVGVRKLQAAHVLTVEIDGWRTSERCYWSLEEAEPLEGDPVVQIRAELETVSELVVRADVPVGVALSGGLDSSAIAALAARKNPNLQAFSVGYVGRPRMDERSDARGLAKALGIDFHEIEVDPAEVVEEFPEVVYRQDDPIADISGFGYFAVARLAREKGVPVLLQGQGGDELFWGYQQVVRMLEESMRKDRLTEIGWRAWPEYVRFSGPGHVGPRSFRRWARDLFGTRSGLEALRRDRASPINRLVFWDTVPDFAHGGGLLSKDFVGDRANGAACDIFSFDRPWPRLDIAVTSLICSTYLQENGITQGDRLSMSSSVELRLPLVDYRLVEVVIGLRKASPDHRLQPKARLRDAVRDLLPLEVLRRPKRGFEPPVGDWWKALFDAHASRLREGFLVGNGVVDRQRLDEILANPHKGLNATELFRTIVLDTWCRAMA